MNAPAPHDWHDRLVDAALHELHGQRPPDLSSRVLLALQAPPAGELPQVAKAIAAAPRPLRRHLLVSLLGLAALFLLVWRLDPFATAVAPEANSAAARFDVAVVAGEVACIELGAAAPRRVLPGQRISFAARPGNRLRCVAHSVARVDPFGAFAASSDTELEVKSMEFSKQKGVLVATTLVLGVVTGAVTCYTLTRTETASAGETLRLEAAGSDQRAADQTAEIARLAQRVKELEQRNSQLETEASRSRAAAPEVPAAATAGEAAPVATVSVPFTDAKYAEALAKIDWKAMGVVSKEMTPLLKELIEKTIADGEMPMDLALKLGQLNMKLVEQVPEMLKAGLPGTGPNGAYTHPLVVANTLATTLDAAGVPLTEGQRASIEGLVRAFSAESQSVADSTHEFAAEKLLSELEMKDRMYSEFRTLLQPEQAGSIYPEGSRAFEGENLFDTGVLSRVYGEPIQAKDAADFARKVSGKVSDQLGLDGAAAAKVQALIQQHAAAASELWADKAMPVETSQLSMLRAGRTQAALRRQVEMLRAIAREVPLTAEQRKKLTSLQRVFVPLPR
ncbi:MAG: hypothetical protein IT455_17180 [Planctomycetes bacterium]|nr:hypothetical protein [Planctomycetota bacterium]